MPAPNQATMQATAGRSNVPAQRDFMLPAQATRALAGTRYGCVSLGLSKFL